MADTTETTNTDSAYNAAINYQLSFAKHDIAKAIELYKKAISTGDNSTNAMYRLAHIYHFVCPNKIDKAIELYTSLIDRGVDAALCDLAWVYRDSVYKHTNIDKAIELLQLAVEKNVPHAMSNLALIYHSNKYGRQNIGKAIKLYEQMIDTCQNPEAMAKLAQIYHHVEYGMVDLDKAIELYKMAIKANNYNALHGLTELLIANKSLQKDEMVEFFTSIQMFDKVIEIYGRECLERQITPDSIPNTLVNLYQLLSI